MPKATVTHHEERLQTPIPRCARPSAYLIITTCLHTRLPHVYKRVYPKFTYALTSPDLPTLHYVHYCLAAYLQALQKALQIPSASWRSVFVKMKAVAHLNATAPAWVFAASLLPLHQRVTLGLQDGSPAEVAAKMKAAILHIVLEKLYGQESTWEPEKLRGWGELRRLAGCHE